MRVTLALSVCLSLISGLGFAPAPQDDDDAANGAKHSISDVMKKAHGRGKLLSKIKDGSASDDEKKELLDLYISLIDNPPPKGEQVDWLMKSGRAVVAAARVVVGRDGAVEELVTATNCKSCHDAHK